MTIVELISGTEINGYIIDSKIGEGGMGVVYKAKQQSLDKIVALKQLTIDSADPKTVDLFKKEAWLLANLKHSGLPRVQDYFVDKEHGSFFVMDFIDGNNLAELLDINPDHFTSQDVINVGMRILEILYYLHSQQPVIVHRDIKPGNIKKTSDGNYILLDFGLAIAEQATHATRLYAPPEFWQHQDSIPSTVQSDFYSLGATLYTLLVADLPPSSHEDRQQAVEQQQEDPMHLGIQNNSRIPEPFQAFLMRSIDLDPLRRYQNATDMMEALQDVQQQLKTQTTINVPRHVRWYTKSVAMIARGLLMASVVFLVRGCATDPPQTTLTPPAIETVTEPPVAETPIILSRGEELPALELINMVNVEHLALIAVWEYDANVTSMAVRPDDQLFAFGLQDDTVIIQDRSNGEIRETLEPDRWEVRENQNADDIRVNDLAFSPDGFLLSVALQHGNVETWRYDQGQRSTLHEIGPGVSKIAFLPDTTTLAVQTDTTILLIDANNDAELPQLPPDNAHSGRVQDMAFSSNGQYLVSIDDVQFRLWNPLARENLTQDRYNLSDPQAVAFANDSLQFFVSTSDVNNNAKIERHDINSMRRANSVAIYEDEQMQKVVSIAVSPNNQLLAVASNEQTVRLFTRDDETKSPESIGANSHTHGIDEVVFTPDGRLLLTRSRLSNHLWLWGVRAP